MGAHTDTSTDTSTDTDTIGFQTHCFSVCAGVGKGKICVGVGQFEHAIKVLESYKCLHVCFIRVTLTPNASYQLSLTPQHELQLQLTLPTFLSTVSLYTVKYKLIFTRLSRRVLLTITVRIF